MQKTKHAGLYYRLDKNNIKTWVARLYINNKTYKRVLGKEPDMNQAQAMTKRLEMESELRSGKSTKVNKKSLDVLFTEYVELRKPTLSDSWYQNAKFNWNKYYKEKIGHMLPQDLQVAPLQKIINEILKDGKAPQTAKLVKEVVSGLYKYLPKLGIKDIENVAKDVEIPKFDNTRNIELTDDEISSVFDAIFNYHDIKVRTIFIWLLHGRRKGEVLNMKWENVDIENKQYSIPSSINKTNKNLTFLMSDYLVDALKNYGIKEKGLVFPTNINPNKIISKAGMDYHWKNIRIETGFKNLNMHDLRHLVGGFGVNQGFGLEKVGNALGHTRDSKVTARYSKVKRESAKSVIDSFMNAYVSKES